MTLRRRGPVGGFPSEGFAIRFAFADGYKGSDLPIYYYATSARRFVDRLMQVLSVLKKGRVYGPRDCYFKF